MSKGTHKYAIRFVTDAGSSLTVRRTRTAREAAAQVSAAVPGCRILEVFRVSENGARLTAQGRKG